MHGLHPAGVKHPAPARLSGYAATPAPAYREPPATAPGTPGPRPRITREPSVELNELVGSDVPRAYGWDWYHQVCGGAFFFWGGGGVRG